MGGYPERLKILKKLNPIKDLNNKTNPDWTNLINYKSQIFHPHHFFKENVRLFNLNRFAFGNITWNIINEIIIKWLCELRI